MTRHVVLRRYILQQLAKQSKYCAPVFADISAMYYTFSVGLTFQKILNVLLRTR